MHRTELLRQRQERLGAVLGVGEDVCKVRWEDARRGKGKRGGLRVIYYYLAADHQIGFFTLHRKAEAADLTAEERKVLKKAIQAELEATRRKS